MTDKHALRINRNIWFSEAFFNCIGNRNQLATSHVENLFVDYECVGDVFSHAAVTAAGYDKNHSRKRTERTAHELL